LSPGPLSGVHWLSAALALSLAVPIAMPLLRRRHACLWTVVWNFGIFVIMSVADMMEQGGLYGQIVYDLGFNTAILGDPAQAYRLVTAMYVHAGALHILMNMLILVLIGVPFEDRIGTYRWTAIYLLTGIIGSLVDGGFAAASGGSHIGIGASGAIFGVMGAFAVLYPRDEIPMVLGFVFLQKVPVFVAVIVMALLESLYLIGTQPTDNIGHLVHVASLVAGVGLGLPLGRLGRKDRERRGRLLDGEALNELAVNAELIALRDKILKEDMPEVRLAWLEEFARKARCPKCGRQLSHSPGKFLCEGCGFKLAYIK
jgi:membrane associated rhomboid family serine protease